MSFLFGSRRAANRRIIDRLNEDVIAAVRSRAFYTDGGIPDTFNGRFELLVLHVALVVRRLQSLGGPGPAAAQDLIDTVFRNLDPAMRELGVGDMAVPKRMKKLAEAFIGRSAAYEAALQKPDDAALIEALSRNIHGGARDATDLARYVRAAARMLDGLTLDDLLGRPIHFPEPVLHPQPGVAS